ncbi:hypothetical protein GMORB2_6138 [Geosmithia morbida]|uniref:Uncharacterized protein n=1 Tax=Geosmithia morbida TaxID=1094350 RepID=A0A9P5D237_9HYPO|nr:uncharacterized protein GMORB2_6138 [Geosmithia morbida]KAF4123437.1 hypothetical protein GMORB2_6138 [Geosmithia morbida]
MILGMIYPVNPSYEIARGLPSNLTASSADGKDVDVRILVHPEAIRVSYKRVRDLVPTLWDGEGEGEGGEGRGKAGQEWRSPDLVLHIGMAGPRSYYQIERRGHRRGYRSKDVDGEDLSPEADGTLGPEEWIWYGCPDEIESDLDVADVLDRWRRYAHGLADLRLSDDAGHYLCDFIYYSSLAHLWKAGRRRAVLFLHVPADAGDDSVRLGRRLAVDLVRSMVESEMGEDEGV